MTFHNRCTTILLSHNKEKKSYLKSIDDSLKLIAQDLKLKKENEHVNLYIINLDKFYQGVYINAKIEAYGKEIAENYFYLLDMLCDYISLESHSLTYISEYRIFAIRTMELALFLQTKQLQINELFFNNKKKYFYENLIKIYQIDFKKNPVFNNNSSSEHKLLEENIKIYSDGIFIGKAQVNRYVSTVRSGAGYTQEVTLYKYLRLLQEEVFKVYTQIKSKRKEGCSGDGGGQYVDLIKLEPYPNKINYDNKIVSTKLQSPTKYDRYDSKSDSDEELESISKSRKNILNSKGNIYTLKDSEKKYNAYLDDNEYKIKIKSSDERSKYKKLQLNKAIGHLQAKYNLNLSSTYNIPKIELLAIFLDSLDKKTMEYKLLVTSILLGIDPKRVISMKLKLITELKLVHKEYIQVNLTTAYAEIIGLELYEATKKNIEYVIPSMLVEYLDNIEQELFEPLKQKILDDKIIIGNDVTQKFNECKNVKHLHNFMLEEMNTKKIKDIYNSFLEEQHNNLSKYLRKQRNIFPKTIVLNIRNLHLYSFYFFKDIHKESDINLLFFKKKTANIHTILAYVASSTNIYRMSEWVEEFGDILNIKLHKNSLTLKNEYSGSNKVVKAQQFKIFLSILMKIESNNKFLLGSIKMIYLRYIFSILLGTRKFHLSCNLKQYSKREQLLLIHEKAKNIYTSKRMIPLTESADRYIKYFYKLREDLNFNSYMPVLLDSSGASYDLTDESLLIWLEDNKNIFLQSCTEEEYEFIIFFISSVVLDFGRHIFASKAHNNMEIFQEYTDAFLNHFSKGTQDQAIYSTFNNEEYIRQVRLLMKEIEKEYIPFWKEIL